MAEKKEKARPGWSDIKSRILDWDRAGLIALIQDLYAASKDNQVFLHTRFALGGDVLEPYKRTIERWLWPDVLKNQNSSISTAKKAISDYKKAHGQPEALAELMVFFCEQAAGFSQDVGIDEGYALALMRMFEQALKVVRTLPAEQRESLMARLYEVRGISDFGYGVGDEMDYLLAEHGRDD
ncbi:MAG: hypothetical protein ACHP7P_11430 [Terriglobales bacterium]